MTVNATTMIPSGTSAASGIAAWSSGCANSAERSDPSYARRTCGWKSIKVRSHAGAVVTVWQELYEELLMKYADGYAYDGHDTTYLGYPAWWLTEVGYINGTAQPCDTPTGTC